MTQPFTLPLAVRDYECDYEGVVNNAVYLNYLEHARHQFLKQAGVKPVALAQQGINLVVIRIEMDYLWSLRSGDEFYIQVTMERVSRLRFAFLQDIYRQPDDKPILKAKVIGTSLNAQGRPKLFPEIETLFANAVQDEPNG